MAKKSDMSNFYRETFIVDVYRCLSHNMTFINSETLSEMFVVQFLENVDSIVW